MLAGLASQLAACAKRASSSTAAPCFVVYSIGAAAATPSTPSTQRRSPSSAAHARSFGVDRSVQLRGDLRPRKNGYTFVQDTEVLPLLRDGTIWTLGADSMDADYERMWRDYLAHDSYKAKGAHCTISHISSQQSAVSSVRVAAGCAVGCKPASTSAASCMWIADPHGLESAPT
jgi:hypothetical protein